MQDVSRCSGTRKGPGDSGDIRSSRDCGNSLDHDAYRRRNGLHAAFTERLQRAGAATEPRRRDIDLARFALYAGQVATVLSNCDGGGTSLPYRNVEFLGEFRRDTAIF